MNAPISTAALVYRDSAEQFDGNSRRAARILVAANDGAQRVATFLTARGHSYVVVESAEDVLGQLKSGGFDLVVSAMHDAEGFELLRLVRQELPGMPVIMVALGNGAFDALHLDCATGLKREVFGENVALRLSSLTARERQVLNLIVAGRANKVIAYELSISPRTVENHRARVMEKLRVKSVAELVRLALSAENVAGLSMGLTTANDTGLRHPATA